jgi:sugar phosphate isomerase/epimerase
MKSDPIVLALPPLAGRGSPLIDRDVVSLIGVAAKAGFDGVSICTQHPYFGDVADADAETFFELLAGVELPVRTSEVIDIQLWGASGPERVSAEARMLDLSARAGADSVHVVALQPDLPPIETAAASIARVCDLAADRGLLINLEPLPFTCVSDLRIALQLLEAADRDNLGLLLDVWHWFRAPVGPDLELVRAIPPRRIHGLQLNDALELPPGADMPADSMNRLLPGEGVIDIPEFIATLREIGAAPLLMTEVFSDALCGLDPEENARRQYDAARAVLDG